MDKEQQRIAIAEACGWCFQGDIDNGEWFPASSRNFTQEEKQAAILCWVRPGSDPWQTEELPDYLRDLNGMHEAKKALTKEQLHEFSEELGRVMDRSPRRFEGMSWSAHRETATASQHAEAFLRTLNLWTDD